MSARSVSELVALIEGGIGNDNWANACNDATAALKELVEQLEASERKTASYKREYSEVMQQRYLESELVEVMRKEHAAELEAAKAGDEHYGRIAIDWRERALAAESELAKRGSPTIEEQLAHDHRMGTTPDE